MVLQILNLCTLLFYEDFSTFWTFDDFYDCCVFVALAFWIFWHVCIELWYFHAGVWFKKNRSCLEYWIWKSFMFSNFLYYIFDQNALLLFFEKKPNQVVRNERLVSNLVCAYYLKSVAFQQASFVGMSLIKDWRYLGDSTLAPEILTYLNCPHVMGNTYSTFLDLYNVHTISLGRTIVSWIYYFELIAGLSYMTCQNHFQIGYR